MIEKLYIHRFRGIREGILEDFGKINLFIGPNNSGKTAILEMLYLTAVCGRECQVDSDRLYTLLSVIEDEINKEKQENERITVSMPQAYIPQGQDFLGYRPFSRIWQRHGELKLWDKVPGGLTSEKSLIYHLEQLPKSHPLRTFRLIAPQSESLQSFEGFSEEDVYTTAMFRLAPAQGKEFFSTDLLPQFIGNNVVLEQNDLSYLWYPSFVHYKNIKTAGWEKNIAVWAIQGDLPTANQVLLFDFHTAHDHFHKSFFDKIYQLPDSFERIAEAIGQVFPELENCRVNIVPFDSPTETTMMRGDIRLTGKPPLPVDAFGDGTRHAFKLLASLIGLIETLEADQAAIFFWEDPELFMHPASLQNLLKVVMDLVKDKPIQIFVTTQSVELLVHIAKMMADDRLDSERVRTYKLNLEDGNLEASIYWGTTLNSWLDSGFDPRWLDSPFTLNISDDREETYE